MPSLLSTADVAARLGVDRKTVLRYLHDGKLRGSRIGRDYRIEQEDLATFLQATSNTGRRPSPVVRPTGLALVTAMANQKGGVAKTTTTLNLGVALSRLGQRVLMIDMDPQASLTISVGLPVHDLSPSIHDVLMDLNLPASNVLARTKMGPDILPSTIDLSAAEILLVGELKREYRLKDKLAPLLTRYDHILIDSPPSLGLLTVNALAAADQLIIPTQCEFLALRGLQLLLKSVERAKENLNRDLRVAWILPTMFNSHTVHANEVLEELQRSFPGRVFSPVKHTVRVKEAPVAALSMFDYDPDGEVAATYLALAKEVIVNA